MTIKFLNRHNNDQIIEVEDVKYFVTDVTCLGITGFDVHYNDGTFNIYSKRTWQLISVKQ